MLFFELAGESNPVTRRKWKVRHDLFSLGTRNRARDITLIHVGFDGYHAFVIDTVDLSQAAGYFKFGNGAQRHQTLERRDQQLPQHIGHPASGFRQLNRDIVVFVAFTVGRYLNPVKGDLECKTDQVGRKAQKGCPLPVHVHLDRGRSGDVIIPDVLDKRNFFQKVSHLLCNAAQDLKIISDNFDVDRSTRRRSFILFGDGNFRTRNIFDTRPDVFKCPRGRLHTFL